MPRFEAIGDRAGIALSQYLVGGLHQTAMRYDQAYTALRDAFEITRQTGWKALTGLLVANLGIAGEYGSTPIEKLRSVIRADSSTGAALSAAQRAGFGADLALLVEGYEIAAPKIDEAQALFAEYGSSSADYEMVWAILALYTGAIVPAERLARSAEAALRNGGNEYARRTAAAVLAEALALLGRVDEAEAFQQDASGADEGDIATHVMALRAAARTALVKRKTDDAERSCRSALDVLFAREATLDQAATLMVWAAIQMARDNGEAAASALNEARDLMVKKGATAVVRTIDQGLEN